MFAGHFGLAAAVKARRPEVPLWALMLSTQLLDVIFVPLYVTGVETIDSSHGTGYGEGVIHADYTHSLAGAVLIALIAGLLAWRRWGRRGGWTIAGMVFSHWILDLLVHRADLPLLPGNAGGFPLLGFGLWQWPAVSAALEAALIVAGAVMYGLSALQRARLAGTRQAAKSSLLRAGIAGGVMALLLVSALISDMAG